MLCITINLQESVDIIKFPSVILYLKRKREGYTPKKSLILTNENVDSVLLNAQDEYHFLLNKVCMLILFRCIIKGIFYRSFLFLVSQERVDARNWFSY